MDLLAIPRATAAAAFGIGSAVRGKRILHPRGTVHECTLTVARAGGWGAGVLDEPAQHDCLVRLSRSLGLPKPLPDIEGLALRLPGLGVGGGPLDVLVVTAWRFVFVPSLLARTWSCMLPYRTGSRRVVLVGARARPGGFEMLVADVRGPWRHWGELEVGASRGDEDFRTVPTLGALDLTPTRLFRRLRAASYTASQSAR